MKTNDTLTADAVAHQVRALILTHGDLMNVGADKAARRVRYALNDYMDSVYQTLGQTDGGIGGGEPEEEGHTYSKDTLDMFDADSGTDIDADVAEDSVGHQVQEEESSLYL